MSVWGVLMAQARNGVVAGAPHDHATYVPGCFRCDLSRDEAACACTGGTEACVSPFGPSGGCALSDDGTSREDRHA